MSDPNQHKSPDSRRRSLSPREQLLQIRFLPRALRLVAALAPGWSAVYLVILVVQGVLPAWMVYLTRDLINALVALLEGGTDNPVWQPAAWAAGLLGLVTLAVEALGSLNSYVQTSMAERSRDHISNLIQVKAVALDLAFFESPENYDRMQRASVSAVDRPLALLNSLGGLLQHSITLTAMAGVLLSFAWWMPLVLVLATAPALWVTLKATVRLHRWRARTTHLERKVQYYHRILCGDTSAAEVRLFQLGAPIMQAYRDVRTRLASERLALTRVQQVGEFSASVFGLAMVVASVAWMGLQAMRGLFNLGELAMFYQALHQGQRLMRTLLGGVGEIYRNLLFIEDLFVFLDAEPGLQDPATPRAVPTPLRQGILIEGVSFRYPGSSRLALQDFSLELPAGQITAIVGENGAGKSTLLRLLCRFYDPEQGRILWDGADLREFSQGQLRQRITVLFQRPVFYHMTASENIALGDVAKRLDAADIERAARLAGADTIVARLPEGYDTVLGKWFGRTELSVGEWQRIALARAFVRSADLVILDEPTSAMDAWAEMDFMGRFRQLASGRTALIITHRFTTAMQADVIHVMRSGRLSESGNHRELLANGGAYAESWRRQMREAEAGS